MQFVEAKRSKRSKRSKRLKDHCKVHSLILFNLGDLTLSHFGGKQSPIPNVTVPRRGNCSPKISGAIPNLSRGGNSANGYGWPLNMDGGCKSCVGCAEPLSFQLRYLLFGFYAQVQYAQRNRHDVTKMMWPRVSEPLNCCTRCWNQSVFRCFSWIPLDFTPKNAKKSCLRRDRYLR